MFSYTHKPFLGMSDHYSICRHLDDLENDQILKLGGALGLHYPKLKRMKDLPQDMVAAWLRREDNVIAMSGEPSLKSLCGALQDIGQKGIAERIKKDML